MPISFHPPDEPEIGNALMEILHAQTCVQRGKRCAGMRDRQRKHTSHRPQRERKSPLRLPTDNRELGTAPSPP